jgi:WhiB family redox-sensing transcriptional regulator
MRHVRTAPKGTAPLADARQWDWSTEAACHDDDQAVFFAPDGERQEARETREAQAKEICSWCPVRDTCAEYALTTPEPYGVWGGMGEDERHAERRRRIRKASSARRPQKGSEKLRRPGPARVPGFGIQRRLRALAVVGHGPTMIAARMGGVSPSALSDWRGRTVRPVPQEAAEKLAALYPLLLEEKPGPLAEQVRENARLREWLGPEAWEGVDLDDPAALPRTVAVEDTRTGQAAIEAARKLLADAGLTVDIVTQTHTTAA